MRYLFVLFCAILLSIGDVNAQIDQATETANGFEKDRQELGELIDFLGTMKLTIQATRCQSYNDKQRFVESQSNHIVLLDSLLAFQWEVKNGVTGNLERHAFTGDLTHFGIEVKFDNKQHPVILHLSGIDDMKNKLDLTIWTNQENETKTMVRFNDQPIGVMFGSMKALKTQSYMEA